MTSRGPMSSAASSTSTPEQPDVIRHRSPASRRTQPGMVVPSPETEKRRRGAIRVRLRNRGPCRRPRSAPADGLRRRQADREVAPTNREVAPNRVLGRAESWRPRNSLHGDERLSTGRLAGVRVTRAVDDQVVVDVNAEQRRARPQASKVAAALCFPTLATDGWSPPVGAGACGPAPMPHAPPGRGAG